MRTLVGYSCFPSRFDLRAVNEAWLARLRTAGFEADGFCLTVGPPAPFFYWNDLDRFWRRGDRRLMGLYERLALRLPHYDVFLNLNGINLHPEFVAHMPTFNVYACFDDPESSEFLSRPVAAAYDLALVGNASAVDTYTKWGVKHARFWPMGFRVDDYDPALTRERILEGERDVDISLLCERVTGWRRERLDKVVAAFPQGIFRGPGWPGGFIPERERVPLLQRTKTCINMHNSSGPINVRTYYLPANGVMQICDNKSHLGCIYDVGREVVGFNTIEEGIDLCRYYLAHDDERRAIAAAGWERAIRDYNEVAVFRRMLAEVERVRAPAPQQTRESRSPLAALKGHRQATFGWQLFERLGKGLGRLFYWVRVAVWRMRLQLRPEQVKDKT